MRTEDIWNAFVAGWAVNFIHQLRYEDLLADPEARLRAVSAFVGFDPSTTTYGAPDASLAYQWRRNLPNREVAIVKHRNGARLATSGAALARGHRATQHRRKDRAAAEVNR